MIYIDSSVALAYLLAEARSAPASLWLENVTSSALLEYEIWNRVHALGRASSLVDAVRDLLNRIGLVEMDRSALARALESWPRPIRTLDALHLATLLFIRARGSEIELASYDNRLLATAQALGIAIAAL